MAFRVALPKPQDFDELEDARAAAATEVEQTEKPVEIRFAPPTGELAEDATLPERRIYAAAKLEALVEVCYLDLDGDVVFGSDPERELAQTEAARSTAEAEPPDPLAELGRFIGRLTVEEQEALARRILSGKL